MIIATGTGLRIDVLVTPQEAGKTNGTLTLHSNDPNTPTIDVPICVEGTHFFKNVAPDLEVEATVQSNRAVWGITTRTVI